jgi:hypothetical protein
VKTALILLRTPFQASITADVLKQEGVGEYDLLYFTQHDAEEDRHYYAGLARKASRAAYCFAPVRRFDILGYLDLYRQSRGWLRDHDRDLTILASIDNYILSAIAHRQSRSEIVTMDDGTANLFKAGIYHTDRVNRRGQLYRRLFGSYDLEALKQRISRHYTLHPQFENIVPADRLHQIECFSRPQASLDEPPITFFLGAPFEEVLTKEQIALLTAHVASHAVDFYVRHPREAHPLDIGAPLLEKSGLIAEDAMVREAAGRSLHVIGSFSSVLLNIGNRAAHKTMMLFKDDAGTNERTRLAEAVGCNVVLL